MKPEKPLTPREKIEVGLTALLMGELPPEEAAALQARLAADPELAALHGRLRKATDLLREAIAFPESSAASSPVQLSGERRERLLAHFKTPAPASTAAAVVRKPQRDWSWAVPLSLAAAVIVAVGGGLMMPTFSSVPPRSVSTGPLPLFKLVPSGPVGSFGYHGMDASSPAAQSREVHAIVRQSTDLTGGTISTATGYAMLSTPAPQLPQILTASAGGSAVAAMPLKKLMPVSPPHKSLAVAAAPPAETPPSYLNLGKATVASTDETTANFQFQDRAIPEDQKQPFFSDVNGAGSQILSGSNTFTGSVAANGGTLSLADSGVTTFGGTITGNTRAQDKMTRRELPAQSKDVFTTATIRGAGGITKAGSGTLVLDGGNTYTGNTTLNGGSLAVTGSPSYSTDSTRTTKTGDGEITLGGALDTANAFDTGTNGKAAGKPPAGKPQTMGGRAGGEVAGSGTPSFWSKPQYTTEGLAEGPLLQNEFQRYPAPAPRAKPVEVDSLKAPEGNSDSPNAGALTAGNRSGNLASNAIDALVFPVGGKDQAAPPVAKAPAPAEPAPARPGIPEPVRSLDERDKMIPGAAGSDTKQLFSEAQELYDTGRFLLAKKRTEQILNADPNNQAAWQFEKKIDKAVSDYGVASYNETRASRIAETDMAWARPIRKPNAVEIQQNNREELDFGWLKDAKAPADTQVIRRKLDSIIIPKVEFREATVREALDYLKKKSVELDKASPAGQKGANIVLKVDDTAPAAATAAAAAPPAAANPADAKITVSLSNIPLGEALKYVTGLANLKYKVGPNAISVTPVTENTDVLVTKEWKIPPDLIPRTPGAGGVAASALAVPAAGGAAARTASDATLGGVGIADRESAKNWLIANGVQFNGAASAILINRSNRLFVRNTEDQIALVDQIVESQAPAKAEEAPKPAASPAPIPQPEIQTSENAFSTFSLNVSDVSFKLAAASLEKGQMPDPSTVRSEEFVNAFDYRDPEPAPGAPLTFATDRARYPFAQNRDLLRFAVKTAAAGRQPGRPLNIVLLLDKSGSMERADRVNIVREALRVLAAQLQPQDKLSIVTFARAPRLWADGVAGDKAGEIIARVGEITPEGGTNLEAALDLGYATARRHYAVGSINRVVLFTDGAANLGDMDPDALSKKVEAQRKQGVALDCFGIGWEGYNDDLLEQLTRHGDGRYGFINTPDEAVENFAAQLAGALQVAASDVKVQVEFNPKRVTAYRQIGYAKHQLTKEQFRDNTVAAAQIGAEESGNALYVVEVNPHGEGDLATVRVRFRVPGTDDVREHEWPVPFTGNAPPLEQASSALRLAGTAAAFSEMLAASPYAAEVTNERLLGVLNGVPTIYDADPRPKKLEWMIRQALSLSGR